MSPMPLTITAGADIAMISRRGAEVISWRASDQELIWGGDPAHWAGQAPILFPVVGASSGGQVRVNGQAYPMPQHGFARNLDFAVVRHEADRAVLRLESSHETLRHYPFEFRLDVAVRLTPGALQLTFGVTNTGARTMPFAIGYHPAFPWPFDHGDQNGHAVVFETSEEPFVPSITSAGLLDPTLRPVPLNGPRLPLGPELFEQGALVFRNTRSREFRFVSPTGAAIVLEAGACPHLALWTKPGAPFLSMEAWTGHADWAGVDRPLPERDSMRLLGPDETAELEMALRWIDA
jgi:galactose mutarotase-like enzyme